MIHSVRIRFLLFVTTFVATGTLAAAFASAQPHLPQIPGQPTTTSTIPPPGVDIVEPDAAATIEHAKRGVVTLEQGGRVVGFGTVLGADPRILTSLSALGVSDQCDVRYVDGHTVHARIGHKDAALDLALLIPLAGRYAEGLSASAADPASIELKSFGVGAQNKASVTGAKVKGRVEARAKDNSALPNLLDFDSKTSLLPGAPLIDPSGSVVGVTVRECRAGDAGACATISVAQPIAAIRNFLVRTPVNAVPPSPWLGIQGAPDLTPNQHGVRVLAVAPSSPAQSGGLKPQDLIFIVDGQPVETPERLQELIAKHAVGDNVKLEVITVSKPREVTIALRAAP